MKFNCVGYDRSGKPTSVTLEAASAADAREQAAGRDIFVNKVAIADERQANATAARGGPKMGAGKKLKGLAMFSRQLQVLVASGTPLVQAMTAIERQCEQAGWRIVLQQLRGKVEQGTPLSECMKQHPAYFDAVTRSLICAGEASGNLPLMLERLAVLSRKQLQLRSAVIGAMVYPCVLISIGISALLTMLMFVLPRFNILFASLDSPLPPTTKFLLWISACLWSYWWILLGAILTAAFTARFWLFSARTKHFLADVLLKLPKLQQLTRGLMTARVSRMLGTLLESRVALTEALHLTKEAAVHPQYIALLASAEQAVERGEPVSSVLSQSDLIAPCVQEALRNGETSGSLGAPLVHMSDFLDEENDAVVKMLTSIIEPAILLTLGVIVGFIAISMFLPMFDLVSAAQRG